MGLFSKIKAVFSILRNADEIGNDVEDYLSSLERYKEMTVEELSLLSDEELYEAVFARTEAISARFENEADAKEAMNPSERKFFALYMYEAEVNNGGLCQFFVNSSRVYAAEISECLGEVGAAEHKSLYDGFIKKTGIDVRELSFFDIEKAEEFEEKAEAYPFDEFDDKFYELPSLSDCLTRFARAHLAEL